MNSFKNFLKYKEAFQIGVDKDYQFDVNEVFQAAKIFTIKYPEKMRNFLIENSKHDSDLKDNMHFAFLLKNNQDYKENPIKPLGDFVGFDILKPSESPISDI